MELREDILLYALNHLYRKLIKNNIGFQTVWYLPFGFIVCILYRKKPIYLAGFRVTVHWKNKK